MLKEDGEERRVIEEEVRVRNWSNIFKKWFTDVSARGILDLKVVANNGQCITMGALLNQSMFLILIGTMKGKTVALIADDFRNVCVRIPHGLTWTKLTTVQELFGLIFDSYKVWPIANFFSTTYIPVERRIVFLSFCGLLWNIYLSLVAARL
jgi:hypothetical protein